MNKDSGTTTGPQSTYELNHKLDGSSFAVRENLSNILERELLGPIHGPEEVLPFSPRSQYLVGLIAPVKLGNREDSSPENAEPDERGDLIEIRPEIGGAAEGRGVPALPADENEADAEDDDTEDRAPKQGLMVPASMGLRFQVPIDLETFSVTASWGTYETVETDEVTKAGRPIRHYQRTPVEKSQLIRLTDLRAGHTLTVPLGESTCLRLDRYDDERFGRVLVEVALCNDRETPTPIPINMWMFQTLLRVDAAGAEVFLPVSDVLEQDWQEQDDEIRRLNLQYRSRLEFAIGRTCSADWVSKTGARRASEVSTTWLPVAETPQTRARSVVEATLGMDDLSRVTPEALKAGLEPLVAGYGAWIDEQGLYRSTYTRLLRRSSGRLGRFISASL